MTGEVGYVYLIHLDRPFRHARHYRGWARKRNLKRRLSAHAAGRGANLLAVVREAGIGWTLVRTWEGTRDRERQLKNQGGATRQCPACGAKPVGKRHVTRVRMTVASDPVRARFRELAKQAGLSHG